MEMHFLCKKCRRAFRKEVDRFETEDEYCPYCDNHYVIDAKTPQLMLSVEGSDGRVDPRHAEDSAADGGAIDHGGYQAAAVAFQRRLGKGGNGEQSAAGEVDPSALTLRDEDLDWE
ncbi:hypothetical protein MSPP1_002276 [Malassezia sp. CBS 17886]|nr:hypothetical protein MSPP1_002276 [Malassezia sp. CBS 17886]